MIAKALLTIWAFGLGLTLQAQQTPFLDPLYAANLDPDIQYGTGSVGNPQSGQIPLLLDLYWPSGAGLPKSLPGFVVIHGGGFIGGTKTQGGIVQLCQAYASRGYVVVSIDYRVAGDFPTLEPGPTAGLTLGNRAMNAAAQDGAKAVRWLRTNAASLGVDPNRIAIGGGSAGAITALFTAYQEAEALGLDANVSVILDLWGGMYGTESLVDADDPPVFIVHGTEDPLISVEESEDLVSRLDLIGLDYLYFPIEGEVHGAWDSFFNNLIEGKTIDRHCAEFFFKTLGLIEIYPGASALPSVLVDEPANAVEVSLATDPNFLYQLFSSSDLTIWNPVHPDKIAGDGNPLDIVTGPVGTQSFYRWLIYPGF
ncbi:MAG: acetyl esterase/lipase [Lentimonas sp.]|jgi:para-nitrobenzyl esterase